MSSDTQVSEAIARPVRTLVQAAPAGVITEFIDAFLWDMSDRQYAALVVLLTLVISFGQNAWENSRGKGLFLRNVPPTEVAAEGA